MPKPLALLFSADPGGPAVQGKRACGLTLLRLWIGIGIAIHGFAALQDPGRMEGFSKFVGSMGFPAPLVFAYLAKGSEFLGGIALALGVLTRPAALFLAITLGVAAFVAHGSDPLISQGGRSKEMALLYFFPFVAFLIMGPGPHSLDAAIARKLGLAEEAPPQEAE